MRSVIKLELVGDNIHWANKNGAMKRDFQKWLRQWRRLGSDKSFTWVKQLLPDGKGKFIQGIRDYTHANRSGSQGIYAYYALSPGVYEINHRYKMNKVNHYFIEVTDDGFKEIEQQEIFGKISPSGG